MTLLISLTFFLITLLILNLLISYYFRNKLTQILNLHKTKKRSYNLKNYTLTILKIITITKQTYYLSHISLLKTTLFKLLLLFKIYYLTLISYFQTHILSQLTKKPTTSKIIKSNQFTKLPFTL